MTRHAASSIGLIGLHILSGLTAAQTATPLGDLNPTPYYLERDSYPSSIVRFGESVYFVAGSSSEGTELWRTDGTSEGTELVRSIMPGPAGSSPGGLTVAGSKLYFWAEDGYHGGQLWVSDGTSVGSRFVRRIIAGWYGYNVPQAPVLEPLGDEVYFVVDAASERQLWRSDGTEAGTRVVRSFNSAYGASAEVRAFRGRAYFVGSDTASGSELWSSDGTFEGTRRECDVLQGPNGSRPLSLTVVGQRMYFTGVSPTGGRELYVTDGTGPGTSLVLAINPGQGSDPQRLTALGDQLVFTAVGPDVGREIYSTDGTALGTILLSDTQPGYQGGLDWFYCRLAAAGQYVFFPVAENPYTHRLWKTDGTPAGTSLLCPGRPPSEGPLDPYSMFSMGQVLYFSGLDYLHGEELWRTDGTETGTFMVREINPGGGSPGDASPGFGAELGGRVFFAATAPDSGRELWVSDGTPGGTSLVRDLTPRPGSSYPEMFTGVGERAFFRASDDAGYGLWVTNGQTQGTLRLLAGTYMTQSCAVGDRLFFIVQDSACNDTLWTSVGTVDGTAAVRFISNSVSGHGPAALTEYRGLLYFTAGDNSQWDLWCSDGTVAGTRTIRPGGSMGVNPAVLTPWNDRLLMTGADTIHGRELWISDGSAQGTMLVKDMSPGTASTNCDRIVPAGALAFLTCRVGSDARQIWRTDGTEAGTVLLRQLPTHAISDDLRNIVGLNGSVVFSFHDPDGTARLWCSDGTPEGTVPIADLVLPPPARWPDMPMVRMGDAAYFIGGTDQTGWELWRSDGTPQGTGIVRDVRPGVDSAFASETEVSLVVSGNYLYFVADDGAHGAEIWRTDGSEAGTTLFADMTPGPAGSAIENLSVVGNRLYASFYTDATGYEPWSWTIPIDCYPNCDGSTAPPVLNVNDLVCFQREFAVGHPYADCDGNGALNMNDFVCFQSRFVAGCR